MTLFPRVCILSTDFKRTEVIAGASSATADESGKMEAIRPSKLPCYASLLIPFPYLWSPVFIKPICEIDFRDHDANWLILSDVWGHCIEEVLLMLRRSRLGMFISTAYLHVLQPTYLHTVEMIKSDMLLAFSFQPFYPFQAWPTQPSRY